MSHSTDVVKTRIPGFDQTMVERAAGVGIPMEKHLDSGALRVRQIDSAEFTAGQFSWMVKNAVEADEVRTVVLDSLNGYSYSMPEQNVLTIHLHELASYLNQKSVTSVFTMTQHGLISERTEQPFDVSYIADAVIHFRHFEFGGIVHKALAVHKNRGNPHETAIRELIIDNDGLHLGPPLKEFSAILSGNPVFVGASLSPSSVILESTDGKP